MQRPSNWDTESHRESRIVGTGERFRVMFFIPRTLGDSGSVLGRGITQCLESMAERLRASSLWSHSPDHKLLHSFEPPFPFL